MVMSPIDCPTPSTSGSGDRVIAQYLATKVTWWATYPRLLIFTPSTLSTYNPDTFKCTNQWEIADIEDVEVLSTSNQFVLKLEKSRFRSAKLRVACAARGHLLSLVARLRRQVWGATLSYQISNTRRLHFRCVEQFADGSQDMLFLQVTVSSIVFLDDEGKQVQTLPFLYLSKVAFSSEHIDGMILSTAFHDRFFLCGDRHECLNEIVAAANEAGVQIYKTASPITALQLRLMNSQVLDRPTVMCFDVKKIQASAGSVDGSGCSSGNGGGGMKPYTAIQLILQGDALVEMHSSMQTVIARPYRALLAIVRPDWDPRTLVLEFRQEDTLVLDVEGRDQLVTLLLLVCREAGHQDVVLSSCGLNYCRFYHPHVTDTALGDTNAAAALMGAFLLRRITQTSAREEDRDDGRRRGSFVWSPHRRRSTGPRTPRGSHGTGSGSNERGGWFQRRIKERRTMDSSMYETRNSIDSGLSLNDNVSISIAMEELNANLSLDELARSGPGLTDLVNTAMKLVFEHLVTLVAAQRRYGETTSTEINTALQALVHLYHHPDACFDGDKISQVFDTLHELILQQDVLISYWCLRLIQCFLAARSPASKRDAAGDRRAKMIQQFVHHGILQLSIVELIPASFTPSRKSSSVANSSAIGEAFWKGHPNAVHDSPPSSVSSTQSSILYTKETWVHSEISVVFYEALLTLHQSLIHLQSAVKTQRAARERQSYMTATNTKKNTNRVASDDVPAVKQTDALAGKLLEKYRFLMDSIVDVRLVRMAETSVALLHFLLTHFASKLSCVEQTAPSNNQISHSHDEDFYNTRRQQLVELGSFLDDYRALTESRAETRSLLFGAERTIELPPHVLTRSEATDAALERLLNPGTTNRLKTVISNGSMRLEYLNPSEPPSSICEENAYTDALDLASTSEMNDSAVIMESNDNQAFEPSTPPSTQRYRRQQTPAQPTFSETGKSSSENDTDPTSSDMGTDLPQSDSEDDFVPMTPHTGSAHASFATRSPRSIRKAFQASGGARRTANECDACIGCNDVCENEQCFFCAEKEYQLQVAFGTKSEVAAGPSVRQKSWQHRVPSVESSFNVEREYSSCEILRHQSQRSCWIRVDGSVYDVTDLLGVHPGGAKAVLEAAQHGGDCEPIMKTHPPQAREMLVQYRLGRYYECSKF